MLTHARLHIHTHTQTHMHVHTGTHLHTHTHTNTHLCTHTRFIWCTLLNHTISYWPSNHQAALKCIQQKANPWLFPSCHEKRAVPFPLNTALNFNVWPYASDLRVYQKPQVWNPNSISLMFQQELQQAFLFRGNFSQNQTKGHCVLNRTRSLWTHLHQRYKHQFRIRLF
jgi:hypothetical protein